MDARVPNAVVGSIDVGRIAVGQVSLGDIRVGRLRVDDARVAIRSGQAQLRDVQVRIRLEFSIDWWVGIDLWFDDFSESDTVTFDPATIPFALGDWDDIRSRALDIPLQRRERMRRGWARSRVPAADPVRAPVGGDPGLPAAALRRAVVPGRRPDRARGRDGSLQPARPHARRPRRPRHGRPDDHGDPAISQDCIDLTTPQPPVYTEPSAPPPPEPRRVGIQQLLDRLVTMGGERAATPQDAEEQRKLDRVARLARELSEALSAVEVTRGPRGSQPA